jgi:structural maintenance of chromosome 2
MGEVVSELQFIVVSLKEGMFNNANVIFRTKFVDGVSTVTRTVPSGSQAPSKKQKAANEQMSQGKVSLFLFIMSIST